MYIQVIKFLGQLQVASKVLVFSWVWVWWLQGCWYIHTYCRYITLHPIVKFCNIVSGFPAQTGKIDPLIACCPLLPQYETNHMQVFLHAVLVNVRVCVFCLSIRL